jgi:hypothetical protein
MDNANRGNITGTFTLAAKYDPSNIANIASSGGIRPGALYVDANNDYLVYAGDNEGNLISVSKAPVGVDGSVQIKKGNDFDGDANFIYNTSLTTPTVFMGGFDANGNITSNVDLQVSGNLHVYGNTTTINVQTLEVEDPIIQAGRGANGVPLVADDGKDRGAIFYTYVGAAGAGNEIDRFIGWKKNSSRFVLGADVTNNSDIITVNTYGDLQVANIFGDNETLAGNLVVGNVYASALIRGTGLEGTLTIPANAQPNITSVGTLSSLTVAGTITGQSTATITGNLSAGNVATARVEATSRINVSGSFGGASITANGNINGTNINTIDYASGDIAGSVNTVTLNSSNANILGNLVVGNVLANLGLVNASNLTSTTATISSNLFAGNVFANAGLVKGATLEGTLTTAAQPNITSVGTLTSLTVSGNVGAGNVNSNFFGNGAGLSGLVGANVTGQVGNALVAGTVYGNAQANITSVGSLVNLSVIGNITSGNVYANSGIIRGNNITAVNDINSLNLNTTNINASLIGGTLITPAQANITSVGTLTSLTVAGTVSANSFTGNATGLSNIPGANVAGIVSSATVAGTVITAAQPNITSVGTLTSLTVGGTVTANSFTGNANGLSNIPGANVAGTVPSATSATTAITVTNAAQANITSVGTLSSLTVTGGVTASGFSGSGASLTNLAGGNVVGNVANANVAGTVVANAQPNITSIGDLTGLTVSGTTNISGIVTTNSLVANTTMRIVSSATAPTAVAGGIYFDGTNFLVCKDGTTWVAITTA